MAERRPRSSPRSARPSLALRRVVAAALVVLAACSGEAGTAPNGTAGAGNEVRIGAGDAAVTFTVEVAATPAERAKGLMNRTEVPKGTGMLFLFPAPTRGGFWMKDTLVDLDIAFISAGRVLEVRRMTPCRADPCPITRPAGQYDRALETAAGELASVGPGDPVEVTGTLPSPA